jgi:hypothetical protein
MIYQLYFIYFYFLCSGLSLLALPGKDAAAEQFRAFADAARCPVFLVNVARDAAGAASAIAELVRGVDTADWTANKALGVSVPKALGGIKPAALKVDAKIDAAKIGKAIKDAAAKLA